MPVKNEPHFNDETSRQIADVFNQAVKNIPQEIREKMIKDDKFSTDVQKALMQEAADLVSGRK